MMLIFQFTILLIMVTKLEQEAYKCKQEASIRTTLNINCSHTIHTAFAVCG